MSMFNFKISHQRCSVKKGVHKNFGNFTRKHLSWILFLIKLQVFRPATLLKRNSNTGVLLWNLQIFKNVYFEEYLWASASVVSSSWHLCWNLFIKLQAWRPAILLKTDSQHVFSCEICRLFKDTYFEENLWMTASVVSFSWLYVYYLCHRFINQK